MSSRHFVPVIVGVGDVKNRSMAVHIEPMKLMLQATSIALEDASSSSNLQRLQSSIDSVSVVATWTWPYSDLPSTLAERLGVQPDYKIYSEHGGNQPIRLVDEAARRISQGRSKVAVVTGGEALASLSACAAVKRVPAGWTKPRAGAPASPLNMSHFGTGIGATHSIGLPIHVYPLYESALRAHRGQSVVDNGRESSRLYADFARISERNPFSWKYDLPAPTEAAISSVTPRNRMICFPYPLLMNAFNNVNLAASCILTSTAYAKELGIPESKWIYPLGGAGTQDADDFWERPDFHSSPSISRSIDGCLELSGIAKEQIDLYDFYSCFPIVPKLACRHLGLSLTGSAKPITLLGGLTFFGGAGNNYSMHALTAMVRELRSGNGQTGLILANGGVLTYQHALCLSSHPRRDGSSYPESNPLSKYVTDVPVPPVSAEAEGEAIIETYTVEFDRQNNPSRGFIVGRLTRDSHRFVANTADATTLEKLSSQFEEPIGRTGYVETNADGRNLFAFSNGSKL